MQVVVPFGLFAPQPVASIAAACCIVQQLWLIASGNYSWLNWLTAVLGFAGFSDELLSHVLPLTKPPLAPIPPGFHAIHYVVAAVVLALSVRPLMNLFSRNQLMNYSYNRFHLVNTYGAFGTVGKERYEIVIEGTADRVLTTATAWKEYGFRAKPGDVSRRPPQIAPYHLRLDWMIWFLPFSVRVTSQGIRVSGYDVWFTRFVQQLLTGNAAMLRLMETNPFPRKPPSYIRAQFYQYWYTDPEQRRQTGDWWRRELLGTYLEPVSLQELEGRGKE